MAFGNRWVKWIKFCITLLGSLYLSKQNQLFLFSAERGLKQCDPVPPLLFITVMEGLNSMMRIANHNRLLKGFRVRNTTGEVLDICHLLYVDGTIIFCDVTLEKISYLRMIIANI